MSTFLKSFFVIIAVIVLGFFSFGLGMGCGLGGSHEFSCRIIAPSFLFGSLGALLAGVSIIASSRKQLSSSWIAKTVFALSIIIPFLLSGIYSILSPSQRFQYLEGMTVETCATGKPTVPWGNVWDKYNCYAHFQKCDELQGDPYLEQGCYEATKVFNEYQDCEVYKDYYNKLSCQTNVAEKKKDFDFCRNINNNDAKNPSELRNNCVLQVIGDDSIHKLVISKYNSASGVEFQEATYCKKYDGLKRDACYADVASTHQDNFWCNLMSSQIPWYKENCLNVQK